MCTVQDIEHSVGWVVRAGPGLGEATPSLSHSLLWLCGQRISSNLTACFHIITAFPSPALLSMLSKMFCCVLRVCCIDYSQCYSPSSYPAWWPPSLPWFITHYIVPSTDLFIIVTYVSLVMRYTQQWLEGQERALGTKKGGSLQVIVSFPKTYLCFHFGGFQTQFPLSFYNIQFNGLFKEQYLDLIDKF